MNPVFAGGVFNIRLMVDDEDLEARRGMLARRNGLELAQRVDGCSAPP